MLLKSELAMGISCFDCHNLDLDDVSIFPFCTFCLTDNPREKKDRFIKGKKERKEKKD